MKEYKTFTEFKENMELIPSHVAEDVLKRINDWLESGGKEDDMYVLKNLKFASKFITLIGKVGESNVYAKHTHEPEIRMAKMGGGRNISFTRSLDLKVNFDYIKENK